MEAVAVPSGFAPEPPAAPAAAPWLAELRRAAFARFEALGFPTPHHEDWRYTGVQPITGTNWTGVAREPELKSLPPAGARVRRLAEALREAKPLFAQIASGDASAFTALNTALFDDALVLEIEKGAVIEEPIELVFRSNGGAAPEVHYPRVLILAGERSQAAIVQTFIGEGRYFTNAVTEISLGDGALLEHTLFQRESEAACHVHALAVRQARSSHFTSHNLAFGGALARTDLSVLLDAEGAECTLNGLFVGRGAQHIDNHTTVDHAKPRGTEPPALQGRARRVVARRVSRKGHRAPRRAEDRRDPDQQEPAAFPPGPRELHAGPRDPGRRRQVQARRRPPASSTRPRSSTCARAASARTPPARC